MIDTRNQPKDEALAYLLLRATIGLNIFLHGATRIFAGTSNFANGLVAMFKQTPLSASVVHVYGLGLPWAEAMVGLLVLLGAKTRLALVAGSLLILSLTFGVGLRQDWQPAGLQLVYAIVYAALLAFLRHNVLSLDTLLERNSKRRTYS